MSEPQAQEAALAFVDSIESGIAKLLLQDRGEWKAYTLPSSVLPKDAKDGMWLRLVVETSTPPAGMDSGSLRKSLSVKDDGGDFSL